MSPTRWDRSRELTRGIWIAGIGLMMIRNRIWPDLLLLAGIVRLVEAFHHPERRRSFRAGLVLVALGLAVACRLSLVEVLLLGVAYLIVTPLLRPSPTAKRKPMFDPRLE